MTKDNSNDSKNQGNQNKEKPSNPPKPLENGKPFAWKPDERKSKG